MPTSTPQAQTETETPPTQQEPADKEHTQITPTTDSEGEDIHSESDESQNEGEDDDIRVLATMAQQPGRKERPASPLTNKHKSKSGRSRKLPTNKKRRNK